MPEKWRTFIPFKGVEQAGPPPALKDSTACPHKNEFLDELIANARKISTRGKGILAADESTGTIGKRFDMIEVENTEDNRRKYRELLFTTEGLEKYISGVILFEESTTHKTASGQTFCELLLSKGIIPGIKVNSLLSCPEAFPRRFLIACIG